MLQINPLEMKDSLERARRAANLGEEIEISLLLKDWDWSKGIPDILRDAKTFAILGLCERKDPEESKDYDDSPERIET